MGGNSSRRNINTSNEMRPQRNTMKANATMQNFGKTDQATSIHNF